MSEGASAQISPRILEVLLNSARLLKHRIGKITNLVNRPKPYGPAEYPLLVRRNQFVEHGRLDRRAGPALGTFCAINSREELWTGALDALGAGFL